MKFGRVYTISAQGNQATHTIQFPLTCRFRISNAGLPFGATCTIQIYNLSPEVRRDLNKDFFQQNVYRKIVFAAGYISQLPIPIILQGNIELAYSYRRGPDWITEITARDGSYAQQNSQINYSVPSPYHYDQVLTDLVKSMAPNNVGLGIIGNFVIPNSRGITFCGNTWDLLVQQTMSLEGQITINKEKVYILNQNEIIEQEGALSVIDGDSGLLESPRHQDNMLICKMLFEPRLEIFQSVTVDSIEPGNSGTWKVQRVDHMGTISGAVAETLNTEVTLFQTPEELILVGSEDLDAA